VIGTVQTLLYLAFYVAIFGLAVWALVDLVRRPPAAFTSAGKRTKSWWAAVLGVAVAVAFMALPYPIGFGYLSFLALVSAVAAIVYLTDVRPAVAPYSGRKGPRGPGGSPRGGW
jgi:predicted CDP-diglyceride synthetase/phosphatidate cytidylyltransferase